LQPPALIRIAPLLTCEGLDQPRPVVVSNVRLHVDLRLRPDVPGKARAHLERQLRQCQPGRAMEAVRCTASVACLAGAALGPTGRRTGAYQANIEQCTQPDGLVRSYLVLCANLRRERATDDQAAYPRDCRSHPKPLQEGVSRLYYPLCR